MSYIYAFNDFDKQGHDDLQFKVSNISFLLFIISLKFLVKSSYKHINTSQYMLYSLRYIIFSPFIISVYLQFKLRHVSSFKHQYMFNVMLLRRRVFKAQYAFICIPMHFKLPYVLSLFFINISQVWDQINVLFLVILNIMHCCLLRNTISSDPRYC